ncbi:polysaccharide deacetylase family protein [Archangium violaceum]|uniref:polysaccharide deacetylase family protein n=1 Tax=Archangium violaceum TaxID=83451 RepID=UPI001950686B|nr:polysaccharide deacetylase family protein [Archangium violaceum]QRO02126.1 polysaccharide deacetylase family protein [Archangium violaceum]
MKKEPGVRSLKLMAATVLAFAALTAQAQSVAFTFDDGPHVSDGPRMNAQQRNKSMLDALAKHRVKAALFVTAGNGANTEAGLALARAWGEAGHAIGNHTMTHPDLNQVTLEEYQRQILDCDRIISGLPGYQKWFRFTFLREGNTPEKRDGMRGFLAQQGYRNAYVSLDTSDWRLNDKLVEVLQKNPSADVSAIREAYLSHIRQRALAYRALSQKLQGRDIAQVILLHHNLINAMWLGDVIAMFKEMGWTITTPQAAFADPVYQLVPDRPVAGQSLLLSMSRVLGLGKFEGWERLVDDGDFEIAALTAKGM